MELAASPRAFYQRLVLELRGSRSAIHPLAVVQAIDRMFGSHASQGAHRPDEAVILRKPMEAIVKPLLEKMEVHLGNWLFGSSATEQVLREIVHDHTLLTPAVMERSKQNRKRPGLLRPLMSLRDHLPRWERECAPRLPTITHPTLILWGKEDRVFPPHVGQQMHTLIPHSTLHVIPSAGHIPQWERPQQVNRLLLTFLES